MGGEVVALPRMREDWLVGARPLRAWVTTDDGVVRPWHLIVLTERQKLVRHALVRERYPTPDEVYEALLTAMAAPIPHSGSPARPRRVLLDDDALLQVLSARLTELGVETRRATKAQALVLDGLVREANEALTGGDERPALARIRGVNRDLLTELWSAAREYYLARPWEGTDDYTVVEVHYPPAADPCYVQALGYGGETYGFALYRTIEDYAAFLDHGEDLDEPPEGESLLLSFDDASLQPFDDVEAMERWGLEPAAAYAYPSIYTHSGQEVSAEPTVDDIRLLAACARVLPRFLSEGVGLPAEARAAEVTYDLPPVHRGRQIAMRYPVPTAMEHSFLEAAHEIARGWPLTEENQDLGVALAALFVTFLAKLDGEGYAESTLGRHEGNLWKLGWLMLTYGGYQAFTPEMVQGPPPYLDEFSREFSAAPTARRSYITTWNRLVDFVASLSVTQWALDDEELKS